MSKTVFVSVRVLADDTIGGYWSSPSMVDAERFCKKQAAENPGSVWQVFAPIASFTAAAPVVTRTEVELPKPAEPIPPEAAKADAEGWIEWKGGECPVPPNSIVEYRLRRGSQVMKKTALLLSWVHIDSDSDIIAYRIIGERS